MSKMKKVAIAGIGHIRVAHMNAQTNHPDVIIVDKIPEQRPQIEIGGDRYEQIIHGKYIDKKTLSSAVEMYQEHVKIRRKRRLADDLNIVDEYRKVQERTSTLSKWERDEVRLLFALNFKKI